MNNIEQEQQIPTLMEWETPEIHHQHVSHNWRAVVIGLLLGFAVYTTIFQKSILTGLTFAAMALVASLLFMREPRKITCRVHPHGISVNSRFYDFHRLDSFWINYNPGGIKEISIQHKHKLTPYTKIPLADQDPVQLRAHLISYLPEKLHEDTLADVLGRKLGL